MAKITVAIEMTRNKIIQDELNDNWRYKTIRETIFSGTLEFTGKKRDAECLKVCKEFVKTATHFGYNIKATFNNEK